MIKSLLIFAAFAALLTASCGRLTPVPDEDGAPELSVSSTPEIHAIKGIPKGLVRQLIEDINTNENNFRLSEKDLAILYENLILERHDLNDDGNPEHFLYIDHSDWCGAGGNCSYWVYRKTEQMFELILEDKVLKPQKSNTNGYRDLWSETPMGFCGSNVRRIAVTRYKFQGLKYQEHGSEDECRPASPRNRRR